MARVHNFNAGPSALPLSALEAARDELLDWRGTGMSVLEHSHRGKAYEALHEATLTKLRRLMSVPDTHEILFLQGGASMLFPILAMNLLSESKRAGYVITGAWGEKALAEARYYGDAYAAATVEPATRVARDEEISVREGSVYLHYTSNETIHGVQHHALPASHGAPLVCDASSDILSRPLDVAAHGLVYAGAQKNVGPTGLVLVLVQKALVAAARRDIPKIFRFSTHLDSRSLYNTIPTFAVYLVDKVCDFIDEVGGLEAMGARNAKKAATLYEALSEGSFWTLPVESGSRSLMNVVFRSPTEALDEGFVRGATSRGLVGLKGHRSVGGMRASLYNAVSQASVDALADYVRTYAREHG